MRLVIVSESTLILDTCDLGAMKLRSIEHMQSTKEQPCGRTV